MENISFEIISNENSVVKFKGEIPEEIINDEKNTIHKEFQKKAKIQGFRQGKAPLNLVIKNYNKEIEQELTRNLLISACNSFLSENKDLNIFDYPYISKYEYKDNIMSFEGTIELQPEINLEKQHYEKIKLTKKIKKIDDEFINKTLEQFASMYASFEVKDSEAKIENKDLVTFECQAFDEKNNKIKSLEVNKGSLKVGESQFIRGFDENLIGLKKEQEKEFSLKLDKNFFDKNLAEKNVKFKVKINEIKLQKLPEMNDEFAQKLNYKDLEDFKIKITENFTKEFEARANSNLKNEIIKKLTDTVEIKMPESLVFKEMQNMVKNLLSQLEKKGMTLENYLKNINKKEDEFKEELKNEAATRVKGALILNEIAKKENITISEEEFEEFIEKRSKAMNSNKEAYKKAIKQAKSENLLKMMQRDEKVLDFIIKNADIKTEYIEENSNKQ